ncbi:MAG: 6-pyruvoyl-tetrahydropterin synthase-related protein, partial [Terriglobales bacterium]
APALSSHNSLRSQNASDEGHPLPDLFPLPAAVIMGTAFAVVLPFFFLGNASGHDFEFHVLSWMEVVRQWKQGILYPRWAAFAHWTYGEARFLFYPPASWNLGGILGVLLPWKFVPGAYVWVALTASGCSMFLLARRWFSREDAVFAAALYAANPYYLVIVYWRSALAELLAGCLLPGLLLVILRAEKEGRRVIVPLSMVVAAAWLTNAPSAVMVNYSLALMIVITAIAHRKPRLLLYGGTAVLLGAALAGFYLIPAAYEEKWVNIAEVLAPGLRPQDNFFFTAINDVDHDRFNLLVSLAGGAEVLVFAVALYLSRKWRERAIWWPLVAWGSAAALLMLPVTLVFWKYLPELRFVQLPWRWLLALNVAFALLVTMAWRRLLSRLLLCAAMLGLLATVWHRVQPPWWDTAADVQEMHDFIENGDGYEGTDEYVPAGVDPYELNKDASKVATESGDSALIHIDQWSAQTKVFSVDVSRPEKLRLRLLNYPAWRIEVNARPVQATAHPVTGEVVFPVSPGPNRVRVSFIQTRDRLIGGVVSVVALLLLILTSIYFRRPEDSVLN